MLKTCELYGVEYDVQFNPKKTKCMYFTRQKTTTASPPVFLCGKELDWVKSFKYLGNWIMTDLSEEMEINIKMGILFGNVNHLFSVFKHTGFKNLMILFNSYCCHYYGSQAWDLSNKHVERVYTAWNKAVRHLCQVPYNTHTRYLPSLSNTLYVKEQLYLRTGKMISDMIDSKNNSVRMLVSYCIDNKTSIIGGNWHIIKNVLNVEELASLKNGFSQNKLKNMSNPECMAILELLDVREGNADCRFVDLYTLLYSLLYYVLFGFVFFQRCTKMFTFVYEDIINK